MPVTEFVRITDEEVEALRTKIGKPVRRGRPYVTELNADAIRHYAFGIGDCNPLWVDADYAARTARGVVQAPPSIVFALDKVLSGYVTGLPGIHAMFAGADLRFERPLRLGDKLEGRAHLKGLIERPSRFAGRSLQQIYEVRFTDPAGELVTTCESYCFRTERDTARDRGKYKPPHIDWTPDQIDEIADRYRAEAARRRGPERRFVEDVRVGERIPSITKGPYTATTAIAYLLGWGGLYVRAHGDAFDLFANHPALGIANEHGVPEPPERVHWDAALAHRVGVPGAYDYGPERVSWLGHVATDWMGDDGVLRRLMVQVRRHNMLGELVTCDGIVRSVDRESRTVEIELEARNQDGDESARGDATVELPEPGVRGTRIVTSLASATSHSQVMHDFSWAALWELFDGDRNRLNIAHECLDRHARDRVAARVVNTDGVWEELTFGELSCVTSQFAHLLAELEVAPGDRVAVMMQPSAGFYTVVFGAIKRGAVAVPLYPLFGPDAVRDRLEDCGATCLIVDADPAPALRGLGCRLLDFGGHLAPRLGHYPDEFAWDTKASDPAVLQYTSGTSRQLPEAVRHDHRAIVTLARAGLFALGLRPSDRYFCPSSPAWGHGLWHGTIAPLSLGIALGVCSGRVTVDPLIDALVGLGITNLAAASTIYRMMLRSGRVSELSALDKASYTGEELDPAAQKAFLNATGISVRGMYGTTETGVIFGNYPGFDDYVPRIGALGKPLPGCEVAVLDKEGNEIPPNVTGEIAVKRRGTWFRSKDLGYVDDDGYYWYGGRADDVIIASGWTISPVEVERTLLSHPDVVDAAVIGVPDELRGSIVKAVLVANRRDAPFVTELQEMVRAQLSPHEYPREVEFVDALPKTQNGKVNRRALRHLR